MDIKKAAVIEAWSKTFGNVTQTCQLGQISRQTYYDWLKNDPEFKAAIDAAEPLEIKLDFIENKLVKKIEEGDTACLIFMAKTLGKKRGYVERQEIDHSGFVSVNFTPAKNCDPMNDDTSQH